jgi:hypothetical protein
VEKSGFMANDVEYEQLVPLRLTANTGKVVLPFHALRTLRLPVMTHHFRWLVFRWLSTMVPFRGAAFKRVLSAAIGT